MSFVIPCPTCQTQLSVGAEMSGQQVQCPTCNTILQVGPLSPPAAVKGPPPIPKPQPASAGATAASRTQPRPPATKPSNGVRKQAPAEIVDLPLNPDDDLNDERRPRRSGSRIVLFLIVFLVGIGGGGAAGYFGLQSYFNPAPSPSTDPTKAATPPDDLVYLPDNCQALATVIVPKLFASESYKTLVGRGLGLDSSQIEFVSHLCGLQPEEIDRITVGARLAPMPEGTAVIRSSKTVRKDELIKNASNANPIAAGNQVIYAASFGAFYVPDEHTVVMSSSPKLLESVIARGKPTTLPEGLAASYKPINDTWTFWAGVDAGAAPPGASAPGFDAAILKGVQAVILEAPAETPLTFQFVVKCKDTTTANALLAMMSAKLQTLPPAQPQALDLEGKLLAVARRLHIEASGTNVACKIDVPVELFFDHLTEMKWYNPEFWIESLTSDDKAAREKAAKLLGADAQQTVPYLLRALDKGGKTRTAALLVLAGMKERGKAASSAVARLLVDPKIDDRIQALQVLDAFGPEAQRSVLSALLQAQADADDRVKLEAQKIVKKLGPLGVEGAAQLAAVAGDANRNAAARIAAIQGLAAPESDSPARMPVLLAALTDKDKGVRAAAAVCFGKVGAKQRDKVFPMLAAALKDAEPEVKTAALAALDGFGAPTESESALLLKAFKESNESPTLAALVKLIGKAGPSAGKDAFPVLFAGLSHDNAAVRAACVAALDALPPPEVAEMPTYVLNLGNDKASAETKQFVLKTLNKLGAKLDRSKFPTLSRTLMTLIETDASLAEPALQALGALGPPAQEDVPSLLRLMQNTKAAPGTRGYAARVLAPLGATSPNVAEALLAGLADADGTIRLLSAEGLSKAGLKTAKAVQAFAKALEDKDAVIRLHAVTALVAMPPDLKTAPYLLRAYADDNDAVVRKAIEGLARVEKLDPALMVEALKSPKQRLRLFALSVLSEQKDGVDKAALDPLVRAARDDSPTVRLMAVNALAASTADPEHLKPALVAALKDMAAPVRLAALTALIKLKQEPLVVVPVLLEAAADKANPLNPQAVEALGKLGDWAKPVVPTLMAALKKEESREAAGIALASIGKEAVKELREALGAAKDPAYQLILLETLGKIGPSAFSALREVQFRIGSASSTPEVKAAARKASDAIQARPK